MKLSLFLISFCLLILGDLTAQERYSILISEIFADPTPIKGLPEKEYLELYNNSDGVIEMESVVLNYNNSEVQFPAFSFAPGAYLIVCRAGNGSELKPYGNVVELSKFSLLNSGTTLTLSTLANVEIHSVTYNSSWYSEGKDQGYSLEMIDLNLPCGGKSNWASSIADLGGTPGGINSINAINPDIEAPFLTGSVISDSSIVLNFSEEVYFKESNAIIILEPAVDGLAFSPSKDRLSIIVELERPLSQDIVYSLTFGEIADCSGNLLRDQSTTISIQPPPSPGELLISELLVDPFPSGGDFVELKNVSNRVINLRGLKAFNRNKDGELVAEAILVESDFALEANEVVCFAANAEELSFLYDKIVNKRIVSVNRLPSLPNEEGELVITSADGQIIDELEYNKEQHAFSIDDPEGVSFQRISFEQASNISTNWTSTSGVNGFATPGYIPQIEESVGIRIQPEIITPDGDGIDEKLSIIFPTDLGSFNSTIKVFNRYGGMEKAISTNLYVGSGGTIEWDGRGEGAKVLPTGYYFLHVELNSQDDVKTYKMPFVIGYSE